MKKLKKAILTLLVMSLLLNPMYLTLRVHAANEELATSRISDTLQSVMRNSADEKFEVMIWLKDNSASSSVLTSTEDILTQAKATLSPRGLCENPATDAELYSQYMAEKKKLLMNYYSMLTSNFVSINNVNYEECYISKYAPIIICNAPSNTIYDLAQNNDVVMIDNSNYEIVDNELSNNNTRSFWDPYQESYFYTMTEIKNYLGINTLKTAAANNISQINIGVIDAGYPLYNNSLVKSNITEHYSSEYQYTSFCHADKVLEILYSIVPQASFFYSNFEAALNVGDLYSEIEWLMDNNVHIITCSLGIYSPTTGETNNKNEYGSLAKYFDFLIKTYTITIIQSAGNDSNDGISPGGTAYNAITVGNYYMGNASIADGSSYYNGDELALKPDVCAPGFIQFTNTNTNWGTSFSTPIIAGIAALIMASYDEMINPLMLKAIICTGTGNRRYPILDMYGEINDNYRKYGAGVVDCWYISDIIGSNEVYYDAIYPNEISNQYYISINDSPDYMCADIVLVFEKNIFYNSNEYSVANLDLFLYDFEGELIASSTTENNNVEVLRDIPTYDESYILVVKQVAPATSDSESTATAFSFTWSYKE